jgi:bacteriorhodopsin
MMGLVVYGQDASGADTLLYGGPNTRITWLGTAWFCLAAGIMAGSALYFTVLSYHLMRGNRIFHWIAAGINIISAYSYAGMALGLGYDDVPVDVTLANKALLLDVSRQVYYLRYLDWYSTTSVSFEPIL